VTFKNNTSALPLRLTPLSLAILTLIHTPVLVAQEESAEPKISSKKIEEIKIWGKKKNSNQAGYTNPISVLTPEDMVSINITTTEDIVKYEPSLVIRRRFIGDSNGTMGIRGSNMFQTSRSMVFADGVPLHYLLQSRWKGAPRWTMVSASEIAETQIVYGPFSAEYSGNAMGGVVLIETAIPQERKFHFDSSFFSQDFDAYGFDESVNGYKTFMSYGDKIGDLSLYFSYNHLDSTSQPQSFYYGDSSSDPAPTAVTGAIAENDERGNARLFFGDTGVVETTTDNYKFKAGYEFNNWFALLNVAYEDRNSLTSSPNAYLRDTSGNSIWGGDVIQNGNSFSVPSRRFSVSELDRDSLSIGLRLKGDLSESMSLEANVNQFDILQDENRASSRNPNDPLFTSAGQVSDFGDAGWKTAEVKLSFNELPLEGLSLVTGFRHEAYELNLNIFNSDDYEHGLKSSYQDRSGGETEISAVFAQFNWKINSQWDASLGGRHESWKSKGGYYGNDDALTPAFETENVPGRSGDRFAPKFSVGFQPDDQWTLRYSVAKAYRFPIVEELYSQFRAFNSINEANPDLKPEDGLHHNLLVERGLDSGYLRMNIFQETISDVIESQFTTLPGGGSLRTFIPIDEVETLGLEFITNIYDAFIPNLDIRFNLTYTDAEITKNDPNPSIVGNVYPRIPEWRGNLLATYHINDAWNVGMNIQYAADSFGRTDNTDEEENVYGAQDGYIRIGLKTNGKFGEHLGLSLGIDNITNEIAYVAHPWSARTIYAGFAYDF